MAILKSYTFGEFTVQFNCDHAEHDSTLTAGCEIIRGDSVAACEGKAIGYGWRIRKGRCVCPQCLKKPAIASRLPRLRPLKPSGVKAVVRSDDRALEAILAIPETVTPEPVQPVLESKPKLPAFVCPTCMGRLWIESQSGDRACAVCSRGPRFEWEEPEPVPIFDALAEFKPTRAAAGSAEKVAVLVRRATLGLPLWHPEDGCEVSLQRGGNK